MNISLPAAAVRAASLVVANKDVRDYLNGIFLDPDGTIVATDGAAMLIIPTDLEPVTIPGFPAKGIIFVPPAKVVPLKLPSDFVTLSCPAAGDYTLDTGVAVQTVRHINLKYPDWRRVVPKGGHVVGAHEVGLDVKYLANLPKIAKALGINPVGDHGTVGVKMIVPPDPHTAAKFEFYQAKVVVAMCIVMPVRLP